LEATAYLVASVILMGRADKKNPARQDFLETGVTVITAQ